MIYLGWEESEIPDSSEFSQPTERQMKPRIGVFAYDFPHGKTQTGLLNLMLNGYLPDVVFGAESVKLNIKHSQIRVATRGLKYTPAPAICENLGIRYHKVIHNAHSTADMIRDLDLDIGVILGARILHKRVIDPFRVGVINLHPGILPGNRGLDNIKWSIIHKMPVGVTAHLIDKHIDKGRLIIQSSIPVYHDDTLVDLYVRNQNLEQQLLIEAIEMLCDGCPTPRLNEGTYRQAVPPDIEATFNEEFQTYKALYAL